MAKEQTKKEAPSQFVKKELIADHEHGGDKFKKGDTITIHQSQVKRLQEWGRIK